MKIGFVGLGIMGRPMALNLIKGGHELFVYDKYTMPQDVPAAGATVCDSSKAVAERSEIIDRDGAGYARREELCCSIPTGSRRACRRASSSSI